jgi:hypothetical protein
MYRAQTYVLTDAEARAYIDYLLRSHYSFECTPHSDGRVYICVPDYAKTPDDVSTAPVKTG